MCGIAGFVNQDGAPADLRVLTAMTDLVRHRGPDDAAACRVALRGGEPDTALGFHRLSILDRTPAGRQPMTSADGTTTLLFNGAIYNAFEHRAGLARDGYRFRSQTDTEVLLALYERDGIDRLLDQIEGMFAIVVADTRQGVVHLVRDRLGIKPLCWTVCGGAVLFASEAKAFLGHPAFVPAIEPSAVDELLAFRGVAGARTVLQGVQHVEPGHRLTITPARITTTRYWRVPDPIEAADLTEDAAVAALDRVLGASVRSQVRSDVPVGCQLSGGVDSSLVTVLASPHLGRRPHTWSVIVDHPRFTEASWIDTAEEAATAIGHRVRFDAAAFMRALAPASWHMDQPIAHPNALALWELARQACTQTTVLLSGEGADELFGGYARIAAAQAGADSARRPRAADPVGDVVRATQAHPETRLAKLRPGASLAQAVAMRRALVEEGRGHHLANCLQYDLRTHLVDLLARQDRMMMAHGIENRVPFLDRAVVELARALPAPLIVQSASPSSPRVSKVVVKGLARRHFAASFVDRPKSAFNLPLAQYFRAAPFVTLMEEQWLPGMAARGLVDVAVVRRWWRRALSAPATTEAFWMPVALELWAQAWLDRRPGR